MIEYFEVHFSINFESFLAQFTFCTSS